MCRAINRGSEVNDFTIEHNTRQFAIQKLKPHASMKMLQSIDMENEAHAKNVQFLRESFML